MALRRMAGVEAKGMPGLTSYKPSHLFRRYQGLARLGEELDGVLARIAEGVTKQG